MLTIQIDQCGGDYKEHRSTHRTTDRQEAIKRAIQKHYGKKAGLLKDTGISTKSTTYGQIVVPAKTFNGYNCVTGRVAITVC